MMAWASRNGSNRALGSVIGFTCAKAMGMSGGASAAELHWTVRLQWWSFHGLQSFARSVRLSSFAAWIKIIIGARWSLLVYPLVGARCGAIRSRFSTSSIWRLAGFSGLWTCRCFRLRACYRLAWFWIRWRCTECSSDFVSSTTRTKACPVGRFLLTCGKRSALWSACCLT